MAMSFFRDYMDKLNNGRDISHTIYQSPELQCLLEVKEKIC